MATKQTPRPHPFESDRLIYRAADSPDDDEFFVTISRDAEGFINSRVGLAKPQSKVDAKAYQDAVGSKTMIAVVICLKPDSSSLSSAPTPIGVMDLEAVDEETFAHRRSGVGISILAEYQNKGYGSEALRWLLQWAFDTAGLHRVELGVFEYNERARFVYERIGFKEEGRTREFVYQFGRWWDDIQFGILEHEWRALRDQEQKALRV